MASVLTPKYAYAMTDDQRLALDLDIRSKGAIVVCIDTGREWQWMGASWLLTTETIPGVPVTSDVQVGKMRVTSLYVDSVTRKLIVEYDDGG